MLISFLTMAVRTGMTLLLGSTGETITEKSGHLNLGIPGIMCLGAAFGCCTEAAYAQSLTDKSLANPFIAVFLPIIAAFIGGALLGLLYSFMTVTLRANQNVTGLALTTLGIGISNYMIGTVNQADISFAGKYFYSSLLPFSDKLGVFGKLFLSYGIFVYIAIAIALATSYIFKRTRLGLHLRAVGENPATADAAGINVTAYRYGATIIGSGVAGLGGLCYIMDNLNGYWEYVIDAMGWLSIALVIFTVWKPDIAILGSIIFGALCSMSSYISGVSLANSKLLEMTPYIVTVLVLITTSIRNNKNSQPPSGLGVNYYREER